MVDFYESVDEKALERSKHRNHLEKAISRTRRLLDSPAAQDPQLADTWKTRLQRQLVNFSGVCR